MWIAKIYVKGKSKPIIRDYKHSQDSGRDFLEACGQAEHIFKKRFVSYKDGNKTIYKNVSEVEKVEIVEVK